MISAETDDYAPKKIQKLKGNIMIKVRSRPTNPHLGFFVGRPPHGCPCGRPQSRLPFPSLIFCGGPMRYRGDTQNVRFSSLAKWWSRRPAPRIFVSSDYAQTSIKRTLPYVLIRAQIHSRATVIAPLPGPPQTGLGGVGHGGGIVSIFMLISILILLSLSMLILILMYDK